MKALKRSDSSPNLRGVGTSAKPFFEAQPFPENIFTDFAEEQMKVRKSLEFWAIWIVCAGAAELPGNPEKTTSRSSSGKVLFPSKDGVGDDKVVPDQSKSNLWLQISHILIMLSNLKTRKSILGWRSGPLRMFIPRKKLQQNKQSQNSGSSKPKVKRHRTDLDRLYVEYQVVCWWFCPFLTRPKKFTKSIQEKVARREKEAKEEELMVKSGKARLHTREVPKPNLWIYLEHFSLQIRKGERDQVLLTQFVVDLSPSCLLSRDWRGGAWRRATTSLRSSGWRWWREGGRRRWGQWSETEIFQTFNPRWEHERERREMRRSERRGWGGGGWTIQCGRTSKRILRLLLEYL